MNNKTERTENGRKNELGLKGPQRGQIDLDEIGETILVTGGPGEFSDLEKSLIHCNEAQLAISILRMEYMMMVTHEGRRKLTKDELEKKIARMDRYPRIVFRETIDLDTDGLLIDGEVPAYWVHLGHGHLEDGVTTISTGDCEWGEFLSTEEILNHLETGKGKMRFALVPICFGQAIEADLLKSDKVIAAWGSSTENLEWSWDALVEYLRSHQCGLKQPHSGANNSDNRTGAEA
uniref:Uncharacterized protein n=1 Tax=uncultured marine group II/III euryarchaeote KM3_185_F09 TaxID=1457950 RepID=A0A075GP71_9EURY|nr:hypothetical protein [uncultured marine group II/III euryarchaeote KM3_185_F09]